MHRSVFIYQQTVAYMQVLKSDRLLPTDLHPNVDDASDPDGDAKEDVTVSVLFFL
jgi:hypothetical protein